MEASSDSALEQDGTLQNLQYPTMKTALPADCSASAVCVCVCVWTLSVTDSYRVEWPFSSRCLSGVPGLLCCGWSYSQRMNRINENSLLLEPAGGTPVEAACKHRKLQRKPLILMWSARLPLFTLGDALPKNVFFMFFSSSSGVQELLVSKKYLISCLTCDLFPTARFLWILRCPSQVELVDVVYSIIPASMCLCYIFQLCWQRVDTRNSLHRRVKQHG